ncbi:mechanosensitive ion channel family protein [Vibrio owensii]
MWKNISLETLYEKCLELLLTFGPFILALIVLFVGWWIIGKVSFVFLV